MWVELGCSKWKSCQPKHNPIWSLERGKKKKKKLNLSIHKQSTWGVELGWIGFIKLVDWLHTH